MAEQTAPQHDPMAATHNASRCHVCIGERAYREGFNEGVRRLDNFRREQREAAEIAPTPEPGDVSSEPIAEGLTEAERAAIGQHFDLNYDTLLHDVVLAEFERILADRLAAVQAERERETRRDHDRWRAEYAARQSAEAERDELRGAGAELLALKDGPRGADYERRKPLAWDALRAAVEGGRP